MPSNLKLMLSMSFILVASMAVSGAQAQPSQVALYKDLPKAHALLNANNFKEAKPFYERFVKANPVLGSQWRNLAVCNYNLGLYEEAATAYRKAAESYQPKECLYGVARSYAKAGKRSEALAALKVALDGKLRKFLTFFTMTLSAG